MDGDEALSLIRTIVATWPEVSETVSHGSPTFWGGKKTFATLHFGGYDEGRVGIWFKGDVGDQDALVELEPKTYYVPKYLGPRGWIGMRLGPDTDWDVVTRHLARGYRLVAPKPAVAALEALLGPLDDEI